MQIGPHVSARHAILFCREVEPKGRKRRGAWRGLGVFFCRCSWRWPQTANHCHHPERFVSVRNSVAMLIVIEPNSAMSSLGIHRMRSRSPELSLTAMLRTAINGEGEYWNSLAVL